ncbi:methyl-accepting chemotaxis protein [Sphingomonas sp. NCPPB 2930]
MFVLDYFFKVHGTTLPPFFNPREDKMQFRNFPIGRRLAACFVALLSLSVLATAFAVWQMNQLAAETRQMMEEPLAKERLVSDWYRYVYAGVRRTSAIAKSSDPVLATFFEVEQRESTKSSNEYRDKIEALLSGTAEKDTYAAIGKARSKYVEAREQIDQLKRVGKFDEANSALDGKFIPASVSYLLAIQELLSLQRAQIDASAKHVDDIGHHSGQALILLGVLSILLGAVLAWLMTRSITRPIKSALAVANQVAAGDLRQSINSDSTDEAGQLLRALGSMTGSLTQMISTIHEIAESVGNASAEIAAGNLDLSERTEQAASSFQETASSMEQLHVAVDRNGQSASEASDLAASAAELASNSGITVGGLVRSIDEISTASKRIEDIIAVIDGIAFQTNILALNAAVEAARAGELGRGFAVVAAKVRSLAQRSATAAREIKSLIRSSSEKVGQGRAQAQAAGVEMSQMVVAVRSVSELVRLIAASGNEQAAGLRQANGAIAALDQATQQNAALVEESAAAAGSLKSQAERLTSAVAAFRVATY